MKKFLSIAYIKDKWSHAGFQKYSRSTLWMLVARILSMVISLFTTIFIARNLGPGNFGQLSYAVSFVGIFSFISSLGIDNILYRELIKHPGKRNEFLGSAFIIRLCAGSTTAVLIILSAIFFSQDDVSMVLIFILSASFIFNSINIINYEFQARVKSKYPSIILLTVTLTLNILKILVIFFDKGVIFLSLVLLLEPILYGALYWICYENILGERVRDWKFDKRIALTLIKDSWPLIFSAAFALIYSRIDQVLIKHMIDVQAVGIYDSAVRIAEVWYFIPSIIISSLFPAIVNGKLSSEKIYHSRLIRLALLLILLSSGAAIATTIFAPYIIRILYGAAFMNGVIILQIYVWSGIAIALGNLVNNYLITENYRRILFLVYLIPTISNVVLNLIWIPHYGLVGSAYATLVSYSLGPLSLLCFKQTRHNIALILKSI